MASTSYSHWLWFSQVSKDTNKHDLSFSVWTPALLCIQTAGNSPYYELSCEFLLSKSHGCRCWEDTIAQVIITTWHRWMASHLLSNYYSRILHHWLLSSHPGTKLRNLRSIPSYHFPYLILLMGTVCFWRKTHQIGIACKFLSPFTIHRGYRTEYPVPHILPCIR